MIFYRYCIPFVLGLTLIAGCRWGYQGEKVYPTEEIVAGETIGPEGGVIPFSEVDPILSGLTVTVPPGALESPQELKVTVTTEQPPQDFKPYSPVIQFEPHGLIFQEPILVKLSFEGDYATAVVYWSTDKEGVYELLEGVVYGNTIEVQVSHFSHAFVGHRNPCGQDLKNNKDHCGSCGRKCIGAHGLPSCREGVCQIDCEEGYTNCGETCCASTETCFEGACCTPDCTGRQCGSDGCGGTCGGCSGLDDACNKGICTSDGVCARAPRNENGACDDGNSCTQTDACQQGECKGADPVICTALDPCHEAGVCNPLTGQCSNPELSDGTTCSDGSLCTQTDTCQLGACTGSNPVTCTAKDQCHVVGTCNPATGICSDPAKADGATCSDGSLCTQTDTCQAGACLGANPVLCVALDQCHVAGTCNPGTGICTDPAKADGTTCNDGNLCTQTDTCQGGQCAGANPVVCAALDQCHVPGTCNPDTGSCSNPAKTDGASCNDGDLCTQTDTCQQGSCAGTNPVTCTALDQCHVAGTCDPGSGVCSNPAKADGVACSDENDCTQTDTCQQGSCVGDNPVDCTALDQCHEAGVCNPLSGLCSNPAVADGIGCTDGSLCSQTDTCQQGACIGSNPVTCTALDQCHVAGTCNPGTGTCSNPAKADGTGCSDGSLCTQTDTCQAGECIGANPVVCTVLDQCHDAGSCNPDTGTCSNPAAADGSICSDDNDCTQTDTCQQGECKGANPVVCTVLDQCHEAGVCNPLTGVCSDPAVTNGTGCSDSDKCTQTDTCQGGACIGSNAVICAALDQCHVAGTCNPDTGACSNPARGDGTGCNDGSLCTQTDTCQAGVCTGSSPVICTALDQCHVAGTCNPDTGACSNPNQTDATGCNDGDLCTNGDVCWQGACQGDSLDCSAYSDSCNEGKCKSSDGTCEKVPINESESCGTNRICSSGSCLCSKNWDPNQNCSVCLEQYAGTDCDVCSSGTLGTYPLCFLPASSFCLGSQCFSLTSTGQTACYNSSTTEIECPGGNKPPECGTEPNVISYCGQDAEYSHSVHKFTCYNADGSVQNPCSEVATLDEVVVDSTTKLMWQRQYFGDIHGGKDWQQAIDYCNGLIYGGYDDWRLPNPHELVSLTDLSKYNPAVDSAAFPNTVGVWYWSLPSYIAASDAAWLVNFNYGAVYHYNKSSSAPVRCVRLGLSPSATSSGDRYVAAGAEEQTVTDSVTGLVWQNSSPVLKSWQDALRYCEGLVYDGFQDWRLPNVRELMSLINYDRVSSASDFPGIPAVMYWTSTTTDWGANNAGADYAWGVNLASGAVDFGDRKINALYVKCVRLGNGCPGNWDPATNCSSCLNHWVDNSDDCGTCPGNWDPSQGCSTCKNQWLNNNDDCSTCPGNWDPTQDCNACTGNWDAAQNCNRCMGYYYIDNNNSCGTFMPLPPMITIGGAYSCALLSNNAVKCWGYTPNGELGLGDKTIRGDNPNEMGSNLPVVDLGAGRTVKAIVGRYNHNCALLDNNTVKCWGQNNLGQLGLGSTSNRGDDANEMGDNLPTVDLGTDRIAKAIAAGFHNTCALLDNGTVKCWGYNAYGSLGLGDTSNRGDGLGEMGNSLPGVDLGEGRTANAIAAGGGHNCALLDNNTVKCWGYNTYGDLGLGDTLARGDGANEMGDNLPAVDLGAGRTAKSIVAGGSHTCALLDDNTVKCWGWNRDGQLGLDDTSNRGDNENEMGENLPTVNLGTDRTAKAIVAGNDHTCALLDTNEVKCWGLNSYGRLGLGDLETRGDGPNEMGDNLSAVDLGLNRTARAIYAGYAHTCALLDDLTIKCWGYNYLGSLGLGDTDDRGDQPNEMGDNLPVVDLGSP